MRIRTDATLSSRMSRAAALVVMLIASTAHLLNADASEARHFSFVVVGHLRGDDNGKLSPLLNELLVEVRQHAPDFVVLTGDMIWGDVHNVFPKADVINRDWDRLDAALANLGVPVHRVPGNHDITDPVSRDIYFARYGVLPQAFTYRGSRFILLNSSWVPEGTDPPPPTRPYVRGKPLDTEQIEFIRKELSAYQQYEHVFLFMHHLLWWHKEEELWWRKVHPLLVGRNVRAVFGGDYGPMKFSHMRRDEIDYIQSSIEGIISLETLRGLMSSRLLSQQFDNYLYVMVDGPRVTVKVETVGEFSLGKFTPQRWRAVNDYELPTQPILIRVWDAIGSPRRLMTLIALIFVCILSGFLAALLLKRYRHV